VVEMTIVVDVVDVGRLLKKIFNTAINIILIWMGAIEVFY
jgi:hypothetical protein